MNFGSRIFPGRREGLDQKISFGVLVHELSQGISALKFISCPFFMPLKVPYFAPFLVPEVGNFYGTVVGRAILKTHKTRMAP